MTAQRVGIVVNPVGDPDTADELIDRLKATADVRVVDTTEEDPGKGMTRQLLGDGCEIVVAAGGDGTVRACAEALAGTEVPLVVLPLGTGNLLAANLDLPHSVEGVFDVVLDGVDVEIDVGRANGEAFLVMAGFGLDTTIMESTEQDAKERMGPLAYVMTALAHLGDEPVSATLTIGDHPPSEMSVATCLAGNMGRVLGALDVFPEAVWDDGELDILAITAEGMAEWAVVAGQTLTSVEEGKHISRWRSPRVVIQFRSPKPYQIDGEARAEAERIELGIEQRALKVRKAGRT